MQDKILKEVCAKYGITEAQGKDLEDQYWMEYVIKYLSEMKHDIVYLLGIGRFESSVKAIKKDLKYLSNSKKTDNVKNTVNKLEHLKQLTDERLLKTNKWRTKIDS